MIPPLLYVAMDARGDRLIVGGCMPAHELGGKILYDLIGKGLEIGCGRGVRRRTAR